MASQPKKRKNDWNGSNGGNKKSRNDGGGHQDILSAAPRELRVLDYVKNHVSEIKHLNTAIERDIKGKTTRQRLPRHLQRRAMAHDIKRFPRSTRCSAEFHYVNQWQKKKTPSRYHRRRPKNLKQEYTRRQRQHAWLETHIWHAKRFHMIEKWGYKLPWKPTEKSERACYRASTKHCLLQDLSYMSCIEIRGAESVIVDGLSHVTDIETGTAFSAEPYVSGTKEGQTVVYQCDRYPYGAIGPVTFMWRASALTCDQLVTSRQLWVWCHPGCFDEVWQEFKKCLNLSEAGDDNTETDCTVRDKNPESEVTVKIESNSIKINKEDDSQTSFGDKFKTDCSAVSFDQKVTMESLTGSILRYRLTGPKSGLVLFDALQQVNREPDNVTDISDVEWKDEDAAAAARADDAQREIIEKFSRCQSPEELPPSCIVALTVEDPRLTRPDKRTKVVAKETDVSGAMPVFQGDITTDMSSSSLWDNSIRDEVTASKISDHAMHKMKSENLVPGTPLQLGDKGSRIPVMLIQRPGATFPTSTSEGRCSGWDILMPKGWGMPFWLSLVFRGARCGGMKESESTAFEERALHFPTEFPDTLAGRTEMEQSEEKAVAKYNRRPPASRTNFTKYGVTSPFTCPWKYLVKEWCEGGGETQVRVKVEAPDGMDGEKDSTSQNQGNNDRNSVEGTDTGLGKTFFVIRDSSLLTRLQSCSDMSTSFDKREMNMKSDMFNEWLTELQTLYMRGIIPVSVSMVQRGAAGQFSMICIPSEEDRKKLENDKNYGGPLEPLHVDPAQIEKNRMKKEYKQKKINKKVKVDRSMKVVAERNDIRVRNGFRNVIGYLTNGGFSLGSGLGAGKGFVSAIGFKELVQSSGGPENFKCLVLVRSPSSLQYRFAEMTIIQ